MLIMVITFSGCGKKEEGSKYTITFADENANVIETISIKKGDSVKYPNITNQEEGYNYSWSTSLDDIKNTESDLFVMVVKTVSKKVTKYYIDDKVIKESVVNYFDVVDEPTVPVKYANYNWERHIEKRDNMYYETYSLNYEYASFSITYCDGYEEIELEPKSFVYGTGTTLPIYNKEGMIFEGWFLSDISMTRYTEIDGDTDHKVRLYARFTSIEPEKVLSLGEYTYQFDSLQKIKSSEYPNAITTNPVIPSSAPEGVLSYFWSSEDPSIALVTEYSSIIAVKEGYTIITGTNKLNPEIVIKGIVHSSSNGIEMATLEEANKREFCEVTFVDTDDTIIYKQKILKGDHIIPPTPPVHEGKAFNGWDHSLYNITEDTIVTATYTSGTNKYAGKKIAIIGDSISTYYNIVPSWFRYYYPYAPGDVYDYYQTWWMEVINRLGGSMFMNNSYSGSLVSDGSSSASTSDGRLAELVINGEKPDVIIIFMGTNDIGSGVTSAKFATEYMKMLKKLKALCPNAEIVLCSLPTGVLYSDPEQSDYLNAIKSCANDYNALLVDLTSVDLTNDLIDRVHPNRSGMKLIADKIIEVMLG